MAPILRSCLAKLPRTLSWIRVLHGLLWHASVWSPFLVFEHATLAHLGLFSLEPQPPSGRRSPLLVQHLPARVQFPSMSHQHLDHNWLGKQHFSGTSSLDQILCAVMISCVFRVRLMEDEKTVSLRRTHQIPLEWSCHCFSPVFEFNALAFRPTFHVFLSQISQLVSLCLPARLFSILSACALMFS